MRTERRPRLRAWLPLFALLWAGCGDGKGAPRELSVPRVDPVAIFPELANDGESEPPPVAPEPVGSFSPVTGSGAKRPSEEAQQSAPTSTSSSPTQRLISLGGRFLGRLPADDRDWRWATGTGRTLAIHLPPRQPATAAIYVEPFSSMVTSAPSVELARFRARIFRVIDPLDVSQVVDAPDADLGFAPTSGTFTGWRWVGETESDLTFRLSRIDGVWHRIAGSGVDRVPAYLVLGTVQNQRSELGFHVAIVCAQAPSCPVARELAGFLGSIHLATAEDPIELLRLGGALVSIDRLAQEGGLPLPSASAAESEVTIVSPDDAIPSEP